MAQQGKCLNKIEVHPFKTVTEQELKEFDCVNRVQYCRHFPEFHAAKGKDIPDVNVFQRWSPIPFAHCSCIYGGSVRSLLRTISFHSHLAANITRPHTPTNFICGMQ